MRPWVRTEALPRVRTWTVSQVWIRTLAVIVAGAIVAGLAFLYLWQGCTITALKAQRAHYVLALAELERDYISLQVQVQEATGPAALRARARALGMCPFTPDRIIRLEDDERPSP